MKFLIALLLILCGALVVSLVVGSNSGYVLLVQPPYRMELSLNLFIILLVVGFAGLHGLLRLISYTLALPSHVRAYKGAQKQKEAHASLLESLHSLTEGRYAKAEKAAARALALGEDVGLSALVAARAAHRLKHYTQRDFYLAEAERLAPQAAVARLLTTAELMLDEHEYTPALRALRQLEKIEPRHVAALRLQLKIEQRLGNWEQVLNVLAVLEKREALSAAQLRELKRHAHRQLLQHHADNAQELLAYWKKIPDEDRLDARTAEVAARVLIRAGEHNAAAQAVEMSLTREWNSDLAGRYGDCAASDPLKQLHQAELWLKQHHDDARLLRSLGKLCERQELWGKARSYLEASLSMQALATTHLELARLLERLNGPEQAAPHYRASLELALSERHDRA